MDRGAANADPPPTPGGVPKRWLIAAAGVGLQMVLGTVYAWSYFQKPLAQAFAWTDPQTTWAFSLAICCLGLRRLPGHDAASLGLIVVFASLGLVFLALSLPLAWRLTNPPAGYLPKGHVPPASPGAGGAVAPAQSPSAKDNLLTGRLAMVWLVFFCNMTAGIAIISFQSPLLQDLWKRIDPSLPARTLETHGAALIAVSSLFNGLGRSRSLFPSNRPLCRR